MSAETSVIGSYARAFERFLDALERRYKRRQKASERALASVLAIDKADPQYVRVVRSYEVTHARAKEARLVLNAALKAFDDAEKEAR